MKLTQWIIVAGLVLVLAGCATSRSALTTERKENRIVFTDRATGHGVTVEVLAPFTYDTTVKRSKKNVTVKGFQYSDGTGKIFVTRLGISDFEELTGIAVPPGDEPVRRFPPGTFYNEIYCELLRAHAAALGREIVIAVYKKSLLGENITCEDLDTIEALSEARPDVIEAFNRAGDKSLRIDVK